MSILTIILFIFISIAGTSCSGSYNCSDCRSNKIAIHDVGIIITFDDSLGNRFGTIAIHGEDKTIELENQLGLGFRGSISKFDYIKYSKSNDSEGIFSVKHSNDSKEIIICILNYKHWEAIGKFIESWNENLKSKFVKVIPQ